MPHANAQEVDGSSRRTLRQRQLTALLARVTAALRGIPEVVNVCGDRGMGKTHFLSTSRMAIHALPATVLHTQCVPGAGPLTAARELLAGPAQSSAGIPDGPELQGDTKSERHLLRALLACVPRRPWGKGPWCSCSTTSLTATGLLCTGSTCCCARLETLPSR